MSNSTKPRDYQQAESHQRKNTKSLSGQIKMTNDNQNQLCTDFAQVKNKKSQSVVGQLSAIEDASM